MNRNNVFRKVALSTLLLSAVAGPTAFADAPKATVTAVSSVKIAATQMLDPLKLAETYAPETVNDWKETLDQYKEALTPKVWNANGDSVTDVQALQVSIKAISAIPAEAAPVGTVTVKREEAPTFTLSKNDDMKTIDAKEGIALEKMVLSENSLQQVSGADETAGVAVQKLASTKLDGELPVSPFFQGWSELEKATESKDAEAIKQALAKQLELYKQEIASLKENPITLVYSIKNAETVPVEEGKQSEQ
ncbi:hypothetical protein [Paenibacillus sp. MBLB4367]|uniref:hypothetical protein n=1 Tax=Paenibacillus sp. MBLB4367 TaxID=3384767 RepID=UPI0039080B70